MPFNCLSSMNWKYIIAISCFHEDIDPILPNIHFMLFDGYWSHVSTCSLHVFLLVIETILPNVHFAFLYRFWSQNTKCPFHAFDRCWCRIQHLHSTEMTTSPIHASWKILISHARFLKKYWTCLPDLSAPLSKIFQILDFQNSEIS